MKASVVIRAYNEAEHLPGLLHSVENQKTDGLEIETIVVDSGSTDGTVEVAQNNGCRLLHIEKDNFSFGRSLNIGCEAASGEVLAFISAHCIPTDERWLARLVDPLVRGVTASSYGRQVGNGQSRFSECQIFRKYFPERSDIPQDGFFMNNANAALRKDVWERYRFDEELSGLEDMALGKRLREAGLDIGYVADAAVFHIHDESWHQIQWRYEREAIALQSIMPEIHFHFLDFLRCYAGAVFLDVGTALQERKLTRALPEILAFRFMQFWGSYRGHHEHRKLSRKMKQKYFYPE